MLSTKVVKVDFKKIIDNSLNKEFWFKRWTLFNYDNTIITMELSEIDISSQKVWLWVRGRNSELKVSSGAFLDLPLNQYNEVVFRQKLLRSMHELVVYMERQIARDSRRYSELESEISSQEQALEDELYEYLDKIGVEDEDVREIYVDNKLDESGLRDELDVFVSTYENNKLYHIHNMIDVMVEFVER